MNQDWQRARKSRAAGELAQAVYYYQRAIAQTIELDQLILIYGELASISPPLTAVALYQEILALDPSQISSHLAIAQIYQAQGWETLAFEHLSQAAYTAPQAFDLDFHLQILEYLAAQQLWPQVIKAGLRALEVYPVAEIYTRVGGAYGATGQLLAAWQLYQQGAEQDLVTATSYNRLGVAFSEQQLWSYAANCFTKAIELQPDYADAHANLGNLFWQMTDLKNAILCFQEAIAIDPNFTQAYYNLGTILAELQRPEEATLFLETAIALAPDFADAHFNLATLRIKQNHIAAAIEQYRQTIALAPDFAAAHWNLGYALLMIGEYQAGWPEYNWRSRQSPTPYLQPPWQGHHLQDQTLLIYQDQGYGDLIQLIRYLPFLKQQASGRIIMQVAPELVRLLQTLTPITPITPITQVISSADPLPPFNYHCPLTSLPQWLDVPLPAPPYLQVPASINPNQLASDRFHLGIVWASGYKTQTPNQLQLYQQKTCPIEHFLELLNLSPIQLYSLQIGKDAAHINQFPPDQIIDLSSQIQDFAATAAWITALDLVITVDTAVAHLAGALDQPAWVILPFAPHWCWQLDRPETPWYPSLRLFRQPQPGDWQGLWQQLIPALRVKLSQHFRE